MCVVDTTGAGDFFYAGFVSNYLRTGDIEVAATFANKVAGASIQHLTLESKLEAVRAVAQAGNC